MRRSIAQLAAALTVLTLAPDAIACDIHDGGGSGGHRRRVGPLGIEFVRVGDPGNEPDEETQHFRRFGGVDYAYWISSTEVTCAQYAAFLNSIATKSDPHELWTPASSRYPQDIVRRVNKDGSYRYEILNDYEDHPIVRMDHRKIFRFMNWLHNGMQDDPDTTEFGAYDASEWGNDKNGLYTDSMEHEPDARYWLNTEDEWYKAAYYDPNKFSKNKPGYWNYPTTHDEEPDIWDNEGADPFNSAIYRTPDSMPVMTIPTTMSPWGAYDMAGSASEYIAEWYLREWRYGEAYVIRGASWRGGGQVDERIYRQSLQAPFNGITDWDLTGFRIVTTIPAPSGLMFLLAMPLPRRRR